MRYGSVCSGIEAATVAWHTLGWKAAFYSEIDKFPCALLKHYYADTPNFGDMTKFKEWPDAAIDVLVGGTPCQSFSVAGLRKGLDDPRGNLTLVYLAIAAKYRPEWLVWENVPGVLSDKTGAFGAFLGGLGQLGYGFAYRVLDAQYAGVPQRRRRVFVVGHFGSWRRAAAVLFERASLRGDLAPSRQTGQGTACFPESSIGGYREDSAAGTLKRSGGVLGGGSESFITHSLRADGFDASEDGTGRGTPLVTVANSLNGNSGRMQVESTYVPTVGFSNRGIETDGSAETLRAGSDGALPMVAYSMITANTGANGLGVSEEIAPTLDQASPHAVAFAQNQRDEVRTMDVAGALAGEPGMKQQTYVAQHFQDSQFGCQEYETAAIRAGRIPEHSMILRPAMQVRRLTPVECERLQGFPDFYTAIPYRGKIAADGNRYKALGNSMAVPVMRWIGERIQMVSEIEQCEVAA